MSFKKIAYIIIGLTVIFALFILWLFLKHTTILSTDLSIDTSIFADYGVIVGGIATAILTVLNIFLLIHTLDEQRKDSERTKIESRFFELIKIHNRNRDAITIKSRSGNKIFLSFLREFYVVLDVITTANSLRTNKLSEIDLINISYQCFFFGAVGENSENILIENLKSYNSNDDLGFTKDLITLFAQRQSSIDLTQRFDYLLFEGHQSRLGHYFRQLFQLVKYIDDKTETILSYLDKTEYIRTLRAQLSTPEQVLFFFNSLSDLGKYWEKDQSLTENKKLITKYYPLAELICKSMFNPADRFVI